MVKIVFFFFLNGSCVFAGVLKLTYVRKLARTITSPPIEHTTRHPPPLDADTRRRRIDSGCTGGRAWTGKGRKERERERQRPSILSSPRKGCGCAKIGDPIPGNRLLPPAQVYPWRNEADGVRCGRQRCCSCLAWCSLRRRRTPRVPRESWRLRLEGSGRWCSPTGRKSRTLTPCSSRL